MHVQVDALLHQVESSEKDSEVLISSLETLAKIAWNDDEVGIQPFNPSQHTSYSWLSKLHEFDALQSRQQRKMWVVHASLKVSRCWCMCLCRCGRR